MALKKDEKTKRQKTEKATGGDHKDVFVITLLTITTIRYPLPSPLCIHISIGISQASGLMQGATAYNRLDWTRPHMPNLKTRGAICWLVPPARSSSG